MNIWPLRRKQFVVEERMEDEFPSRIGEERPCLGSFSTREDACECMRALQVVSPGRFFWCVEKEI